MRPPESDRTVHAFGPKVEVVRYDRAGKWYIEPKDGSQRQHVTITDAVEMAMWLWKNEGSPAFGRPGGGRFDALVRARCEAASVGRSPE